MRKVPGNFFCANRCRIKQILTQPQWSRPHFCPFPVYKLQYFFGKSVWYQEKEDGTIACRVKASLESMKRWAVMYANSVKVLSPASLVADIRKELEQAAQKYAE